MVVDPTAKAVSEAELLENLAWVQALARKLVRDAVRADDVAQEVWLSALERPPRERSGAPLRAWLARVVRTLARQSYRAEERRTVREHAAAREEAQPAGADVVARTEQQQRLVEAVLELGEPERTTLLLRYVDGLSASAIAVRQGETPAAVRQRLSRALGRLRQRFARERGGDGRPWICALVPFAFARGGRATTVALGKLCGGALVTKTTWTVGVMAVVVALLVVVWRFAEGPRSYPENEEGERASVALSPVEHEVPATAEEPAAEPAAPDDVDLRVPVAVEEPAAGPEFRVIDPERRPVACAELRLCREGVSLASGATDAGGHFVAPPLDETGEAKLLVVAAGWPAQAHDVDLGPTLHEVALRKGAVLSGRIVVDGGRPAEPIALRLCSDEEIIDFEEELGLRSDALGISASYWISLRTRADADGVFRFDGLPVDWSGELELPQDYRILDPTVFEHSSWRMRVPAPAEGLRVEVSKELALKGRIVDVRDGDIMPLPDIQVYASIEYANAVANASHTPATFTGTDGRFRFPLADPVVKGGSLSLSSYRGGLSGRFELPARELDEDWERGDVPIVDPATTRTVQIIVVDTSGVPIVGAVAGVTTSTPISAPTDADGRTTLRGVVPGGEPIVVYAPHYRVGTAPLPVGGPEELTVELERGAGLELHLIDAAGEVPRMLQVLLSASRHPIRTGGVYPASVTAISASGCGIYHLVEPENEPGFISLYAGRDGRVIVNDLEPGLPLHLRVVTKEGDALLERDLAPLGPEEWRELDLELDAEARALRGRVLDEAGEPVVHAHVSVDYRWAGDSHSGSMSTGVGADGGFSVNGIYADTVSFRIRAQGYVPLSAEDYPLPGGDEPVEIRLESGHDVRVQVRDQGGRPVPARVHAYRDEVKGVPLAYPTEVEPGTYLLRDLPAEAVTIRARVHGVTYGHRARRELLPLAPPRRRRRGGQARRAARHGPGDAARPPPRSLRRGRAPLAPRRGGSRGVVRGDPRRPVRGAVVARALRDRRRRDDLDRRALALTEPTAHDPGARRSRCTASRTTSFNGSASTARSSSSRASVARPMCHSTDARSPRAVAQSGFRARIRSSTRSAVSSSPCAHAASATRHASVVERSRTRSSRAANSASSVGGAAISRSARNAGCSGSSSRARSSTSPAKASAPSSSASSYRTCSPPAAAAPPLVAATSRRCHSIRAAPKSTSSIASPGILSKSCRWRGASNSRRRFESVWSSSPGTDARSACTSSSPSRRYWQKSEPTSALPRYRSRSRRMAGLSSTRPWARRTVSALGRIGSGEATSSESPRVKRTSATQGKTSFTVRITIANSRDDSP